ncbi:MAG: HAD family hydrolase [Caldimonas sp.]
MPATPRLALFDLDGTLLSGDTDELWCEFLMAEGVLDRAAFAARNAEVAERYARGAIAPAEFCAFYASTLAGRGPRGWLPLRQRFIDAEVARRIPASAQALVERHRSAGDRLVLTTATNRFLTEPVADLLGIPDLIATELELEAGVFTGRNRGVLNMREGKRERLDEWLAGQAMPPEALAEASFYSDSMNDLPLLAAVGRAIVVDPDERMRAEAGRRGWPILRLAR